VGQPILAAAAFLGGFVDTQRPATGIIYCLPHYCTVIHTGFDIWPLVVTTTDRRPRPFSVDGT